MPKVREALPCIPAIALSALAEPEHIDRSAKVGFNTHLAKPATLEQLTEAIATVLRAA